MSCKYKAECPSYSGWCEGPKQSFERCIPFLITALENERSKQPKMSFICDHRACTECHSHGDGPEECRHTSDVRHAAHFENFGGLWVEQHDRE